MSPIILGIIGLIVFLLLIYIGMPIGFSFALVGFLGIIFLRGLDSALSILGAAPYTWASQYSLLPVPLFILMGQFAFHSGISNELYNFAYKWVGKLPGGLALTTMTACTGFAACTGSIAIPEMKKLSYNARLTTGVVAAGGTIGILIPPSIIFIIYGVISTTSIGKLFIAGILPGLMLSTFFFILIFIMCKWNPSLGPPGPSSNWKEKLAALPGVFGVLILFSLVIFGMYFGIFTPSEAGGIGSFGAFIIMIAKRKLTLQILGHALRDSVRTTCFIFTILIGAMIFSAFLTIAGLPAMFSEWIVTLPVSRYVILIFILLMYIPLGMIMDCLPMILLTMPVVLPVINTLGFDKIWFGVLLVIMSEMALISPPVGMNVYIIQGIAKDIPLEEVFIGAIPFTFAMMVGLAILVAFPQISLFLPGLMK
jgi:tripartite ATP-independent transporter DctM subunit